MRRHSTSCARWIGITGLKLYLQAHPGTVTYSVDEFDHVDSLTNMNKQVEKIKGMMGDFMKNHSEGVHLLCFSQGRLIKNVDQPLQLGTARTVWSDPVIRPVLVRSGKFTTLMVTNEKQRKTEPINN